MMADNVVQFSRDQDEALNLIDDARDMVRRGEMSAMVIVGANRDGVAFHSFFVPPGLEIADLVGNLEIAKARVLAEIDAGIEVESG